MTTCKSSGKPCISLVAARNDLENDGSNSIVRKAYIMENTQPMKTKNESGSPADISGDSTRSAQVEATEKGASTNSSPTTTATMQSASKKTWTSAELAELRLKAGLVAGALADFQAAGGLVVTKNIEHEPGKIAVKVYLVADGLNIMAKKTPDGLDLVAEPSGIVAEAEK